MCTPACIGGRQTIWDHRNTVSDFHGYSRRLTTLLLALSVFAASPASSPTSGPMSESEAASAVTEGPEVQVPFGCGLAFPVSQAHETGSHLQNDTWAWDFRMPEGTPIVAAADGVVRLARGDSEIGGCDPAYAKFANYVVVTHGDGVETQYLHFQSVTVKQGQKVKAGELLGYSGSTGWACGAHLHFKVAKPRGSGWNNPSIPARISGYGDPQTHALVTAPACRADEELVATAPGAEELEDAPPSTPAVAEVGEALGGSKAPKRGRTAAGAGVGPVNAVEQAGGQSGQGRVEPAASGGQRGTTRSAKGR